MSRVHLVLCLMALLTLAADWANHPENQWVKQSPRDGAAAPKFSWEGSGSYDPFNRMWIHHAGHDGVPQGFHLFTYDLNRGVWEQKFPNTSPPGACCVDGSNVFDVANRRFVRFPGASLGHGYQWSRGVKLKNSNAWLYNLDTNTWTNMRPPPYRPFFAREGLGYLDAGATYDPIHEVAISFGGQGSAGGTNNLFAYDAYANTLHRLTAANPPSPRDGMGLTYDARNDCLVMFGSQYDNDEKTWIYRYAANRWEAHDLQPHPPGKKLGTYSTIPKMGYDTHNGVCLCVVWDTNTNQHQTWVLDVAKMQWTALQPATEPAPSMSRSRNLDFCPEYNVFLLEISSKEGKGNDPQLWTYRYKHAPIDTRPMPPTDLQVITARGKATLTWAASKTPVKEYHVYRAQAELPWQAEFKKVAAVQGTAFTETNLAAGAAPIYQVRAIGSDGTESQPSRRARTQPRVLVEPVVSVLGPDKVEVGWKPHPGSDVAGYNIYSGAVQMRTVKKGTPAAWKDNDPEYAEPMPVEVRDITDLHKVNDQPITATTFLDAKVSLLNKDPEVTEYKYHVHAYIVRAVNQLGVESGPSPYALTIPSEPTHVLNREVNGLATLKWNANPEKGILGYRIYKLDGTWNIVRLTDEPIQATTFDHKSGSGKTRYWIVAVDALGQEGQPSSAVWHNHSYPGFFQGEWHQ